MASSNVSSSNNQTSQLPDLGLGNQQAASTSPLKKPQSTSKSALDSVTLATQNLSISSNEKAALSELSKSTLSPNAKEFVPKSHLSQPQVQHQQPSNAVAAGKQYHPQQQHQQHTNYNQKHHHHHSKSNSNGTNGVPRSRGNHWQNNEPSYPPANDDSESEDYYALTYLSEFINQVSAMPHVYDEEILNLTEILNSCIDEDEDIVLQCIVNNIIDSAIIEPNFRYSAVKLCDHLINNLATTSGITGKVEFKNELLNRCQREHSRRASLMCSSDKGDYLRGLTLFIADLSTKLTDEPILLNALPDLMQVLLSENDNRPSDNNVRTVVNAMKVSRDDVASSPIVTSLTDAIFFFSFSLLALWSQIGILTPSTIQRDS